MLLLELELRRVEFLLACICVFLWQYYFFRLHTCTFSMLTGTCLIVYVTNLCHRTHCSYMCIIRVSPTSTARDCERMQDLAAASGEWSWEMVLCIHTCAVSVCVHRDSANLSMSQSASTSTQSKTKIPECAAKYVSWGVIINLVRPRKIDYMLIVRIFWKMRRRGYHVIWYLIFFQRWLPRVQIVCDTIGYVAYIKRRCCSDPKMSLISSKKVKYSTDLTQIS